MRKPQAKMFGRERQSLDHGIPGDAIDGIRTARDAEWTRALYGEGIATITPDLVFRQKVKCPVHSKSSCTCSPEYRAIGAIGNLPSYGLIANDRDNPVISRRDVIRILSGEK